MKTKNPLLARVLRYPIAIVCALVVIVCLVLLVVRGDVIDELSQRESELTARLRVIDKNMQNAKDLAEDVEEIEAQVGAIRERLFNREERAINTNFFYGFEDRVDVVINGVNQMPSEDPSLGGAGPNALSLHSVIVYDVEVRGSFNDIVELLYEFHASEPFIRVSDFQLNRGANDASARDLNARLRLVVLAEKNDNDRS